MLCLSHLLTHSLCALISYYSFAIFMQHFVWHICPLILLHLDWWLYNGNTDESELYNELDFVAADDEDVAFMMMMMILVKTCAFSRIIWFFLSPTAQCDSLTKNTYNILLRNILESILLVSVPFHIWWVCICFQFVFHLHHFYWTQHWFFVRKNVTNDRFQPRCTCLMIV